MKKKDFRAEQERYRSGEQNNRQIFLPADEYAHVVSEFNSHMSDDERKHRIITKPIGDYYYTVINQGFNEYVIIGKRSIVEDVQNEWGSDDD